MSAQIGIRESEEGLRYAELNLGSSMPLRLGRIDEQPSPRPGLWRSAADELGRRMNERPFEAAIELASKFAPGTGRPGGGQASDVSVFGDDPARFFASGASESDQVQALRLLSALADEVDVSLSGRRPPGWTRFRITLAASLTRAAQAWLAASASLHGDGPSNPALLITREAMSAYLRLLTMEDAEVAHAFVSLGPDRRMDHGVDREAEIRRLLVVDESGGAVLPSWIPARDESERAGARALLTWWAGSRLLPRGDIRGASQALRIALQATVKGGAATRAAPLPETVRLASSAVCRWLPYHPLAVLTLVILGLAVGGGFGTWFLIAALVSTTVLGLAGAFLGARARVPLLYLLFPQVAAGSIVGATLVGTLSESIAGRMLGATITVGGSSVVGDYPWASIVVGAVGVAAIGLAYLRAEILSVVGPYDRLPVVQSVARAGRVLLVCAMHSVLSALVLSALLAGPVYGVAGGGAVALGPEHWGLWIVPKYVVFASVVSFFVGLVLQRVWEDRATAEPPF